MFHIMNQEKIRDETFKAYALHNGKPRTTIVVDEEYRFNSVWMISVMKKSKKQLMISEK